MKRADGWRRIALTVMFFLPIQLMAGSPVAFLVGIDAVESGMGPEDAVAGIAGLQEELSRQGVGTVVRTNATPASLRSGVAEFLTALEDAEAGLFFYAGPAIQDAGENYLLLSGSGESRLFPVSGLVREMAARTKVRLVVLDAGNRAPDLASSLGLKGVSATALTGLGDMPLPPDTLAVFAQTPGSGSETGEGSALFGQAMLQALKASPQPDLLSMMNQVRTQVVQQTRDTQVPWINSTLSLPFYLEDSGEHAPPEGLSESAVHAYLGTVQTVKALVKDLVSDLEASTPLRVHVTEFRSATPGEPGISSYSLMVQAEVEAALGREASVKLVSHQDLQRFQQIHDLQQHDMAEGKGEVFIEVADARVSGQYAVRPDGVFVRIELVHYAGAGYRVVAGLLPVRQPEPVAVAQPSPAASVYVPPAVTGSVDAQGVADKLRHELGPDASFSISLKTSDRRNTYRDGDQFSLEASLSTPGWLVILNHDKEGNTQLLYPVEERGRILDHARIQPGESISFPGGDHVIEVGTPYGVDAVQAFAFTDQAMAGELIDRVRRLQAERNETSRRVLTRGLKTVRVSGTDAPGLVGETTLLLHTLP